MACARALINKPDLIFADEPTGNLDSNSSAELLAFLRRSVTEFGQSIVMVTHDPRERRVRGPGRVPGRRQRGGRTARSRPPTRSWSGCGSWAADMWKVTIKGLLAHKLRLALTALAIVLGVTFISGTFVLTDTLHNTFTTLFGNIYQKVDFQVRGTAAQRAAAGTRSATDARVAAAAVRRCPASPSPRARSRATPSSSHRTARPISTGGAPTLGVNFDPDQQISPAHLASGRRRPRRTTW